MGLFNFAKRGRKTAATPQVAARLDIAQKSDDHRHWANADSLSLDGALSSTVRATIRNRARYERLNNSYLSGIAETMASDLIGTGPRLQLHLDSDQQSREIERLFYDWACEISLPEKLRTMRQAKLIDGESFALMFTNSGLSGVQLDLRLIEAEQVATPLQYVGQEKSETPEGSLIDGIEFDSLGNIIAYKVLRYHPGSNFRVADLDFARVPAEQVFHWFNRIRPAQNRGLSEVAPCLRLFGDLRRYTSAVIAAAETAADFAAFIHSNSPAAEVDEVEAFASMEIEKRSLVTLPEGWDISQLRAEQPTATFGDFRRNIISEIGRCLQVPYAVAALDSSSHNYASARMDAQLYTSNIRVQRDEVERVILDRIFRAWVDEAVLVGKVPEALPAVEDWHWSWKWDGKDHVDPVKEANAAETRLQTHTTTLAAEYAKQGKDWQTELEQRAVEVARMKELGLFVDFTPEVNYGGTIEDDDAEESQPEEVEAAEGYTPPKAAQKEAAQGLEMRRKHKRGGTAVGVARARDISNGKSLPIETIARMVSFFARHKKNRQAEGWNRGEKGYPSNGLIAHKLWGGSAGERWANAIWKRYKDSEDA